MSIEAPLGDLEEFVSAKVASGEYRSREEVLREAVGLLRERDERWAADVRQKIEEGLADVAAGRTKPLDEAMAELRAWAQRRAAELAK